jgi:hypothetical protein
MKPHDFKAIMCFASRRENTASHRLTEAYKKNDFDAVFKQQRFRNEWIKVSGRAAYLMGKSIREGLM